jgi:hypothetical protein
MFGFLSNGNIYPKTMEKKPVQACFQALSLFIPRPTASKPQLIRYQQPEGGWLMPSSRLLRGNGWGWGSSGSSQVVPKLAEILVVF